jgi:enoyl-CoA hydratase/carnithine racemase
VSEGTTRYSVTEGIATVTFDRPAARNAMTWAMYERLNQICQQLTSDSSVRVVSFRGAGGQAFVAGTDIEQFTTFSSGEDGVAYEKQIDQCIARLESLPMPTLAVIEGWTIGGGLAIATACDFRIATAGSRFGVPIAKTLGNCLSVANLARLCAVFGMPRVKRMLMLAELLTADEALACGFLLQLVEASEIDVSLDKLCERLAALAPLTQSVSKEGLRRLVSHDLPADEDLVRLCYGSDDFREGVEAFVLKKSPVWKGS